MAEGRYEETCFGGNGGRSSCFGGNARRSSSTGLCDESIDVESRTLLCEESANVESETSVCDQSANVESETLVCEENADVESETLVCEETADVESGTLVCEQSADVESENSVPTETSNTRDLQLPQNTDQGEAGLQLAAEEEQVVRRSWFSRQIRKTWVQNISIFLVLFAVYLWLMVVYHEHHGHGRKQTTVANLDKDFTTMSMKVERKY